MDANILKQQSISVTPAIIFFLKMALGKTVLLYYT